MDPSSKSGCSNRRTFRLTGLVSNRFEGSGYQRVVTTVTTAEGDVDACIYVAATEGTRATR